MATRACIHITKTDRYPDGPEGRPNPNNGPKEDQWYHHWDGYPIGLGLELTMMLATFYGEGRIKPEQTFSEIERLLKSTFNHDYETERVGNWHGDLEYVYHIDFDGGLRLHCHKRNMRAEPRQEHDQWREWQKKTLFFASVREFNAKPCYVLESIHVEQF